MLAKPHSDTAVRDDSIDCRGFPTEAVHWEFQGHRGWSRIEREGGAAWQYDQPLDHFGRDHLLEHFGLTDRIDEFPIAKLRHIPPAELRALANRSNFRLVDAAFA